MNARGEVDAVPMQAAAAGVAIVHPAHDTFCASYAGLVCNPQLDVAG